MVPLGGRASFEDIARQTGLTQHVVSRLLRHAITMRLFQELQPGVVAHTKASRLLVDPLMNDWLRVGTEEVRSLWIYRLPLRTNITNLCSP